MTRPGDRTMTFERRVGGAVASEPKGVPDEKTFRRAYTLVLQKYSAALAGLAAYDVERDTRKVRDAK